MICIHVLALPWMEVERSERMSEAFEEVQRHGKARTADVGGIGTGIEAGIGAGIEMEVGIGLNTFTGAGRVWGDGEHPQILPSTRCDGQSSLAMARSSSGRDG